MDKDWAAEALAITRCTGDCCNTTAIATALRSAYERGLEDAATRLEIDAAGWDAAASAYDYQGERENIDRCVAKASALSSTATLIRSLKQAGAK